MKYKVFIIDPYLHTVEPAELQELEDAQEITGIIGCDLFCQCRIARDTVICLDDEGLSKDLCIFKIKQYPNPLAGKGVVSSHDQAGETIDVTMSLEDIKNSITWLD